MKSFVVNLTVPPSVNQIFRNVSAVERTLAEAKGKKLYGRKKTKEYVAWRKTAILEIFAQVPAAKRIAGAVNVTILLPQTTQADVDNLIKPILDALVDSRRIDDDRNVWRIEIEKIANTRVVVHVKGYITPHERSARQQQLIAA